MQNIKARQTHGGKGDSDRTVNRKQYADNWDRIFKPTAVEPEEDTDSEDDELPLGN